MVKRQRMNIFLVQGKDRELARKSLQFLRVLGLAPVCLRDHGSPETVVDRFETYASDAYAVVLLSGDSEGEMPSHNALFQLGFFVGKLGRRHVTALHTDLITLPTELEGVLCLPYDEIGMWKFALVRDLVSAGFQLEQKLALYRPKRPEQEASVRTLVRRG